MYREREIIEACKRLDSIAQKTLYEHFLPMAYNLCKRYISDPDELKDILQEGFIKVFMSIETFSYKGSFEGWMKRIFISTTVSHLRKHKNYRYKIKYEENINLPDNTVTEPDNVLFGNQIDKKDIDMQKVDFEMISTADFSREELMNELANLPECYRIVFNLFCIEGIGHEEIAAMLKINHATSRSRLNKARTMLQKALYEKVLRRKS